MADGSVPIVLSPEPFARTTTYVEAPAGCTVRTMLTSAVANGHLTLDDLARTNVYVDGARLDRDEALSMLLAEGQVVNVVVEPLGGGGGGKKDVGQILLTIAVIAVSMWVGGPAGPLQAWPMLARQVAAAAILTAGQMAVAAIFKPETNVSKANDRYALSSASNQYRQWGAMPLALGEVVVAPDLAVKTFTQAQGEDQWIYGILGLHYGPCTVEDLKIGDTLVSSMGAGDVRVAYHLTPGPRSFSIVANDTDQLDLQEELAATVSDSTAVVRAASAEGELFQFDFFMPQGLYFAKDDGRKIAASLTVTIRYRPIDQNGVPTGSGAWANGLTIPLSSASSDPWRIMRELTLPLGRYEFEVKRSKLEDDNAKRKTAIGWTAIRAIAFRKPVLDETLALIEFAVRASALNQGNLAPFTCRITPICETWTGTAWGAPAPTSNPAAITRWLMTGPAPAIPLTKPQADVGLRTWAALCDQYNWKSHIYLTEDRKQDAVMQLLGMNGRASLFWDGTQLVSAPWVEKPAPRQLFAGSNLKDHRWEIVYPDTVHALRVEFQNIDQAGEADEIYVYADGYGETADPANGILPATLVEALRLEGQQTIERAYRDGRWNLGARMHQRRVDSWSTDIEHIVCRYGDRVRLAWDRVGTANATVRNRLWSGGLVSGLRLSQPVRMEPGRVYALDLRLPDQVITGVPIVNPATTADVVTRSIMFADLRNANVSPRGGDLVAFGEPERISEDVEIIGITPGTDLTANMVGIRYVAPLLMAGETGPIPPLQSRLTRDRAMDPPTPTLLGWQANEEGVRIGFSMPPWRGSPITGFSVRWRQAPEPGQSSGWVPLPDLPANAMTAVTPPLRELPAEGTNVTSAQVQIVAVTADGRASTPPLQITVQEAAIQQPPSGDWTVTELTEAPDGSRQSGFLVIGLVGSINPRRVTVEYGASVNGPWDAAFDGAPVQGVVRAPILGMSPGAQCWIAITYWTAQAAAPSVRRVLGPYTAPSLVAGDVSPTAPGLSQIRSDMEAAFGDIFNIDGLLTQARTDIDAQGAEIAAARGGQPNLNSRIVQVNQARIDGDTANATAITNLTARTATTEADIIDLENAVATEVGARAQAVNQLTARLVEAPNLLANSDGALGLKGWNIGSGAWEVISHPAYGTAFRCASAGTHFLRSDFYPCEPGQLFNLSLNGDGGSNPSGDQVGYIEFWSRNDDLPNTLLGTSGQANANDRDWLERRSVGPVAAPGVGAGGAWFWRMILRKTASTDAAAFTRIMINSGPAPVQWSDQATGRSLSASVTQHSLAIIDLENQQNIALWRIKAEASGSRPAIIEAYSGLGVSALAFSAEQLYLGDNTVFDDATNTWQTIDGSTVYIRAEGAPFGAFNNLREWWGPTGIALGGMTPDNGYSGRMTTAPYNFTNTLNPRTFSAYASPGSIEAHRSNAGSLTSAAVSILYQNAKGAVSVTWERLIGGVTAAGTAVIDAPTALTTTFTKTVSAQERTDTVFQATLTDAGSGERRQVIVPVVFTSGAA